MGAHIDPPRRVGGPPPDPSSPIATAAQVPSSPFRFATALVGIDHAAFKATIIVQNTDLFHPEFPFGPQKQRQFFEAYPATFFACFLTFAHRFFAALAIAARPAADKTRFLTIVTSRSAERPRAFAAARTPLNRCWSLPHCFSSFLSSRLIAARMSMNPPS